MPVVTDLSEKDKKVQTIMDLIPKKEEDLSMQTLAQVIAYKKKENLSKIVKQAVHNPDKFHNGQLMREQIQNASNIYAEKQEKIVDNSIQEFIFLTALMQEYHAFAENYNSQDLKKIKENVVAFCTKADCCNHELVSGGVHLKTRIDRLDAGHHNYMALCLAKWMHRVDSYDYDKVVKERIEIQEVIDQLQINAQKCKEAKNKELYKSTLQEIIRVKKIFDDLDSIYDAFEIVSMFMKLHCPGGALDLYYVADKQQSLYKTLLQQPDALALQNIMNTFKEFKKNACVELETDQDKINKLLPCVKKCIEELALPVASKDEIEQIALNVVKTTLQQAHYHASHGAHKNSLPKFLGENELAWLHSEILDNATRAYKLTQNQMVSVIKLKKYLVEFFFELICK